MPTVAPVASAAPASAWPRRFRRLAILAIFLPFLALAAALYIVDQVLFNFTISIRTFFQKIADAPDIGPSMAVGVTVNHIAAVVVPLVGGALWMLDYRIPFFLGFGFALMSLIMTRLIRLPAPVAAPEGPALKAS